MDNTNFIYWLNGAIEYVNIDTLTEIQAKNLLKGIKDHLQLVTQKVTPDRTEYSEDPEINEKISNLIDKLFPVEVPPFTPPNWTNPFRYKSPFDKRLPNIMC